MTIKLCSGFGRYHTDKTKNLETITFKEIAKMAGNPLSVHKQNAQWFIPSILLTRNKKRQVESGKFYALTADIDDNPPPIYELERAVKSIVGKSARLIYLSRSATRNNQKSHVIIPIQQLDPYRWKLAQQVFNNRLIDAGIQTDLKVLDHNQIIYLPNRGDYYSFRIDKSAAFNPLLRKSWHEAMTAKHEKLELEQIKDTQERAFSCSPPPMANNNSLIGTFNSEYTVQEILIKAGYSVDGRGTNFRHPNSNTGNFSVSVMNTRVFTLSSSDPLFTGNSAHDAFSAFTVLFCDGNLRLALIDAGDNWLRVDGMSWNAHAQQQFRKGI